MGRVQRRGRDRASASSAAATPPNCSAASTAPRSRPKTSSATTCSSYRNAPVRSALPYRDNGYVFDQMNGAQSELPGLPDQHPQGRQRQPTPRPMSRASAATGALPRPVDGRSERARQALGVLPPKWVFPYGHRRHRRTSSAGRAVRCWPDNALWSPTSRPRSASSTSDAGDQDSADRDGASPR